METNSPAPAEVHATRAFEKDEGLLQKDDAPMSTAPQVEQVLCPYAIFPQSLL